MKYKVKIGKIEYSSEGVCIGCSYIPLIVDGVSEWDSPATAIAAAASITNNQIDVFADYEEVY